MKSTKCILLLTPVILLGAFFVIQKASAVESLFQTSWTTATTTCFNLQDGIVDYECATGSTGNDSYEWRIEQALRIPTTTQKNISKLDVYVKSCNNTGGSPQNLSGIAYLLDQDDWNAYVANGNTIVSSRATSTSTTIGCNGSSTYEFTTPYYVSPNEGNDLNYFVLSGTVPIGARKFPNWAIQKDQYPDYVPSFWEGTYRYGGTKTYVDATHDWDFQFDIYENDATLTVSSPEPYETLYGDVTISGTCNDSVELFLSYGEGLTYEDYTISGISCTNNTWSYFAGDLSRTDFNEVQPSTWDLTATSGGLNVYLQFYVSPYTSIQDYTNILRYNTTTPFSQATATAGFWGFIQYRADKLMQHTRPYSYLFQIISTLYSAMDNASSTSWSGAIDIPPTNDLQNKVATFTWNGLTASQFQEAQNTGVLTTFRSWTTIGLWLGLVYFLWHKGRTLI